MTADGAYDGEAGYSAVADRHPGAAVVIPPRVTAVPNHTTTTQSDRHLAAIAEHGRIAWQRSSRYSRRRFRSCMSGMLDGLATLSNTGRRINWQIHPAISPQGRERIIGKRTPDSFHETSLIADLAAEGINRLLIMGAQTELCVDTTCRRASSLGFNVTLVSDGHSTWDSATLTADQIIRHTNDTLNGWFVRLVRANEVGGWDAIHIAKSQAKLGP